MWEQRSLAWTDRWSFTMAGQPWLHHEWLADLVYYGWTQAFGMRALVFWKWLVMLPTFLLLMRLLHRLTGSVAAAYLAVLAAIATAAPFLDMRPHLYSLLGSVLLLYVLLLRPRPPWWLPLVFVLWVNLHGGFFFGLMTLTVVLGVTMLRRDATPAMRERAAIIWLASVAAALLNPYGFHAFGYPLKYALDPDSPFRAFIHEWSSPFSASGVAAPLYPLAVAVALAAAVYLWVVGAFREPPRGRLAALALAALTLAMSLRSRRFIPLFAVAQSLLLAPALAQLLSWLAREPTLGVGALGRHAAVRVAAPLGIAVAAGAWLVANPPV